MTEKNAWTNDLPDRAPRQTRLKARRRRRSIALLPVLLALALAACEEPEAPQAEIVRPVWAIRVGDVSALVEGSFPGRAKAQNEVNRSFRVSGPLITRPVDVGDEVKKGDVIAQIDPQDFEVHLGNIEGQLERAKAELEAMRIARPEDISSLGAAVQSAQAALTLANQELQRVQRIKAEDPGAVSQSLIDQRLAQQRSAQAGLRQAREALSVGERGARAEDIAAKEAEIRSLEASVQRARDDLSYTFLRAPFDSVVVATFVENFEFVQAQQPIIRLLDPASIEFTIFVPENLIGYAPYVKSASVRFDALPDVEVEASIKEIAREASQATRTYPVTLLMEPPPGAAILPGMAGQATITAELPEDAKQVGIEIPATAVFSVDDSSTSYVWVVDETSKKLSRREVEVGGLTDYGVLVRTGLEPGEWIVFKGVHSVNEGQQVRIIDESESPS